MYVLCDTVVTTYRNKFFVREIGSAAFCHLIVVMKIANVDRRLCTFLQNVLCLYKDVKWSIKGFYLLPTAVYPLKKSHQMNPR